MLARMPEEGTGARPAMPPGDARGYNPGMEIVFNGEPLQVPESATVADLLARAGLADRRVAVELNRAIVPRSRHGEQCLAPGDRVEVVHAIGGG